MSALVSFLDRHTDARTVQAVVLGAGCLLTSAAIFRTCISSTPKGCPIVKGSGGIFGIFGVMPDVWKTFARFEYQNLLTKYHEAHGSTFYLDVGIMKFFVPPMVVTRDPQNVKYMLKTKFDNFVKGENFHAITHDLLGDGIFNADGDSWFKQRKIASQMFTATRFKEHIWKVVDKNCSKVLSLLTENGESVIDMFNVMNRFTLDSIGEIGFGADIGSLENPVSPFLKSFDEAQRIVFKRVWLPGWRYLAITRIRFLRFLGIGQEGETQHHMGRLREYSRQIVKQLATSLDKPAGDSFVGLFMLNQPEASPEFLADLVLNFLIAGRDTTAQAMSWCLFLLMQHPAVEQRLFEEVQAVTGGKQVTYEQLASLTYTDAVLRESLRLHPSVPLDPKYNTEAISLPDGTFLPRDTMLVYNSYSMGRSKEIWGPDASDFRPERFLNAEPREAYDNPVFHAGPRECLGKRLAMVEMKALIASMIQHAKFRLAVPLDKVLPDNALTLGMSSGLPCHVEVR